MMITMECSSSLIPYIIVSTDDVFSYIVCIYGYNEGCYLRGAIRNEYIVHHHFEGKYFHNVNEFGAFSLIARQLEKTNQTNYELFMNEYSGEKSNKGFLLSIDIDILHG